jgi:hypothetical protein
MTRLRRILAITAGLIGLGAGAGAAAGTVVAMVVGVFEGGLAELIDLELAAIGAVYGATLGALLLPIAGWLLMRRVPIGRALLGTMLGTIAGGLVGWFAPIHGEQFEHALLFAIAGFGLAVLRLRHQCHHVHA